MYAATGWPNVKWGAPISNGGSGTTGPSAGDDLAYVWSINKKKPQKNACFMDDPLK